LSRTHLFGSSGHKYEIVFDQVLGLRKGDNVFVRGVDVGRVDSLTVRPDGAHVYCSLEVPIQLHTDYKNRGATFFRARWPTTSVLTSAPNDKPLEPADAKLRA